MSRSKAWWPALAVFSFCGAVLSAGKWAGAMMGDPVTDPPALHERLLAENRHLANQNAAAAAVFCCVFALSSTQALRRFRMVLGPQEHR
jgi:hypothetical protein